MSVYIPGMEMPTRCYACPCADLEYYDCNLIPGTRIEKHKRLDNCPLVPVPPHGRLGDLEQAVIILDRARDHCGNEDMAFALNWAANSIRGLSTIIPADPAEEGE